MSLLVTFSNDVLLFVIVCNIMLLLVTNSYYLLLFVTICNSP